ncbi:PTS transporter subunit EIIC [Spiroplasma turonicum]|uniref:PTS system N-acetylglucosamine-specific IIBC component n=1 Tax=Spiroplasma turonicum TaxID=216946 RepID=A0A0K1P7J6_9MOLU|nr:PTS transporter subunit EIIC [Spiroplasma turonicum]AKU80159.1 PTS system N-acetylglucosamine-specific IIBC component [Spiroplasma turonicum]ALX71159.1 PTS system, N-acetylglucosamine-specific IIC component [Spiroplasma turonicum]
MAEAKVSIAKSEKKVKVNKTNSSGPNAWSKFLTLLQELGKTLQFPIAVLPFAAILNRFGALGMELADEHSWGWWISLIIQKPGSIPFDNLPLLFAIGCAFGLAKDHRGEVALVAVIFYLAIAALTAEGTLPEMIYSGVNRFGVTSKDATGAETTTWFSSLFYVPTYGADESTKDTIVGAQYVLNIGVLGGIVAGCLSAYFYNRLKDIKLPTALSFFGGRRFVPMVAIAASIPVGLLFAIVWPWIQFVLMKFGNAVANPTNPAVAIPGTMVYGILNRLLLPFGLHQILNTFFWFQMPLTGDIVSPSTGNVTATGAIVNGDINAFAKGLSTSGLFQSGFFPIMMGGLPLAAIAMIMAARKEKRKEVAGFLGGVAGVSFLSGITEPIEFSFVFIAPVLLGIHAILTGIFVGITTAMSIQVGFGFSAGFIDYAISFAQSWGLAKYHDNLWLSNPLWILVLSAAAGAVYFFVFLFVIKFMKLQTPGRELLDENAINNSTKQDNTKSKVSGDKYAQKASIILDAIGSDNFVSIDNCATRLRLILKDNSKIDDAKIKSSGAFGLKRLGSEGLQIVIGPDVEHVANALKNQLSLVKK